MNRRREFYLCWRDDRPGDITVRDKPMVPNALKSGWSQVFVREVLEGDDEPADVDPEEQLTMIRKALRKYHKALTDRKHGGVAAGKFVDECRSILDEYWQAK